MSRPVIVPVDLGGSPTACHVRPPLRTPPTPALVSALIAHYRAERAPAGAPLEVAFFHGGTPSDALLQAAEGCAIRVSCSPADLSRAEAARLWDRGVRTLELEALTFHTRTLKLLRRGYAGPMVVTQLTGLRAQGFRLGVTLAPGLPGTSHDLALDDVAQLVDRAEAPRADFVRIYPALALEGSELAALAEDERWTPMHLGEAVTTVVEMTDRLSRLGIAVARVGLQPGQDVPARAVAGPTHPNLRQLVEVRRFRRRMAAALTHVPEGSQVELSVNPRDLAWAKGTANENIRSLRARLSLQGLQVRPDDAVSRGEVALSRVV